jgi:isoleucyl-tRNA synthetase
MAAQQGSLPEKADFAAMEEKVMGMWKTIDAFKTSLKLSEGKPEVG